MGSSSSRPEAPPPATVVDNRVLANMLQGFQSQSQLLAQQLVPPTPQYSHAPSGGWPTWKVVLVSVLGLALLGGVVVAALEGLKAAGFVTIESFRGTSPVSIPATGRSLPRSRNQPSGIEFTYSFWLLVNDWSFQWGKRKNVFLKGDRAAGQVWLGAAVPCRHG